MSEFRNKLKLELMLKYGMNEIEADKTMEQAERHNGGQQGLCRIKKVFLKEEKMK